MSYPEIFPVTDPQEFLGRGPRTPHLVQSQRGNQGEIAQLWQELKRQSIISNTKQALPVSVTAAGSVLNPLLGAQDFAVSGRGLVPIGWRQATLLIEPAGNNNGLYWVAVTPGVDGNNISIRYVDGGALAPTTVVYDPATRIVTVTMDIAGAGGDTANNVLVALAAGTAKYQVMAFNPIGSTGAGQIPAAVAATNLTGGLGRTLNTASLSINPAGANNELIFESRVPGPAGNATTIAYTVGLGANLLPVVTVRAQSISIQIRAATTTANEVITSIFLSEAARRLISIRNAPGSSGAGTLPGVVAATHLAGGSFGSDLAVTVAGTACLVSTFHDEGIVFDIPVLPAVAQEGEEVLCEIKACGYTHTFPIRQSTGIGDGSLPTIYGVDLNTLAVAGDLGTVVRGKNLIPVGWNQASAVKNLPVPVANTAIEWIAVQPGVDGNTIGVQYTDAGPAGLTTVAWNPATQTVTLDYDITAAVNTAAVTGALAVSATGAQYVVMARPAFGSTGLGVLNAIAPRTLIAGGSGQRFARANLLVNPAAGNNEIIFEARVPGPEGENITVEYVNGGVAAPVTAVVDRTHIIFTVNTGVSTAAEVLDAARNSLAVRRLVDAYHQYGSNSTGVVTAMARAALTGGTVGTLFDANLGGQGAPALLTAYLNEGFVFDHPALGESFAAEIIVGKFDIGGHVQYVNFIGV